MSKSHELKSLQTRHSKLSLEIKAAKEDIKAKQQACNKLVGQLNNINNEIKKLTKKEIVVSEHAILRFMERAMDLDIVSDVTGRVLTESFIGVVDEFGDGNYPIDEGLVAVVKDRTVVTIKGGAS